MLVISGSGVEEVNQGGLRFNLVIEMLVISGMDALDTWTLHRHVSFNLVIEMLVISGTMNQTTGVMFLVSIS